MSAEVPKPRTGRRRKGALRQRIEYFLYLGIVKIIRRGGEERARRWGERLAHFASAVLRGRTHLALRNVAQVFPAMSEPERRAMVRRCWEHFGRIALEYLLVQQMDEAEVASLCTIEGREVFEAAMALDRGVLLLSAHFGSWEMGATLLSSITAEVKTVARPLDNELLERDLSRSRSRSRVELVDRRHAARPLVRALEQKAVVVLLPDQAVKPREGILVPFLGIPAWTTTGPARLSLRQGSPILFVFCIPEGRRSRIVFEETIDPARLAPEERNVEWITRRINEVISARIVEFPEYWLWMHDRWKGTKIEG
jgi:KDO2-lipid IV(A) lauroyltransferase